MTSAREEFILGTCVKVTDIFLKLERDRKPSHELKIILNDQTRPSTYINTQDRTAPFHWSVSNLHVFPGDTLKITARRSGISKFLRDEPLCQWTRTGAELLEQCRKDLAQRESSPITLTMSIVYFVNEKDQLQVLSPPSDVIDESSIVNVVDGLKSAYDYVQANADVLELVDGGKQILDAVGNIHPFAKAAVLVLTVPYKIWRNQKEYEKSLRELQASMTSLLSQIVTIHSATVTKDLKKAILGVMKAFLDGVCMLDIYSSSGSIAKLLKSQFRSEIDDFKARLDGLKDELLVAGSQQVLVEVHDIRRDQVSEQATSKVRLHLKPVELSPIESYCWPGTRVAILAEIDNWITSGENNVIWITGQPGSGKSTIATSIFQKYQARCARFFFRRDQEELRMPGNVWRTIAWRLAELHPEFMGHYFGLVGSESQYVQNKNIEEQFKELIQNPLEKLTTVEKHSPLVVLIDALDECESAGNFEDQYKKLLKTMRTWNKSPTHCKLVITSRDYPVINQALGSIGRRIELLTGDNVDDASRDDVRLYLASRFEEIDPSRAWPSKENIDHLASIASGLFIWAKIALDFLGNSLAMAQSRLPRLPGDLGSRQKNIDRLYEQVLDTAAAFWEGEEEVERHKRVLGAILSLKTPLTIDSLSHLLGLRSEDVNGIVQNLGAIIPYPRDPNQPLRICHKSLSDFMKTSRARKFLATTSQIHFDLASCLLNILQSQLRFNICNLETPYLFNHEVDNLKDLVDKHLPPYLIYASRYWATHMDEVKDVHPEMIATLAKKATEMVLVHLLHWLEVIGLVQAPNTASEQLLTCKRWAKEMAPGEELASAVTDAANFATRIYTILESSALHVYQSAVPFAPEASLVYQRFGGRTPDLECIQMGRDLQWPTSELVMRGHDDDVICVAFSPDGKRIVSGSSDKTIRLWDSETGASLGGPIRGHDDEVLCVAFSPDGKKIVSCSVDHTIRLWNSETGVSLVDPIDDHSGAVNTVVFSPDGSKIVSCSEDRTIRIWNPETGVSLGDPIESHNDGVNCVAFSPDGKKIVSCSEDRTIRLWNLETRASICDPIEGHDDAVNCVAFSPDGTKIVSCSDDETIRQWNSETGVSLGDPIEGDHYDAVLWVAFSPDGKRIVSCSADCTIRFWDSETGTSIADPVQDHDENVNCVAFSPYGNQIASCSDDHTILLLDLQTTVGLGDHREIRDDSLFSLAFSPDGKKVVSTYGRTARLWNSETGASIAIPLKGHDDSVMSVAFSLDGNKIVSGSADCTIRLWNSETGVSVGNPLEGHDEGILCVAFSPDSSKIVSCGHDKTIRLWNSESGASLIDPIEAHDGIIYCVAFSPDGKTIVSCSGDRTVRLWNSQTGASLTDPLKGHSEAVMCVAFSPDGSKIVSCSDDHTLRLWDSGTGASLGEPLKGHDDAVLWAVFSPDGAKIVSCSDDRKIRFWDSETRVSLADPIEYHSRTINCLAFSPDGKMIVSCSEDGTIRGWDLEGLFREDSVSLMGSHHPLLDAGAQRISSQRHIPEESRQLTASSSAFLDYRGRPGPPDSCYIDSHGWLIWPRWDHQGKLLDRKLLWLPPGNRVGFGTPRSKYVIGPRETRIDWTRFVHGEEWLRRVGQRYN